MALRGLAEILTAVAAHFGHWQQKEQLPRVAHGGLQVTQRLSVLRGLVGDMPKSPPTLVQVLGCSGPYGDSVADVHCGLHRVTRGHQTLGFSGEKFGDGGLVGVSRPRSGFVLQSAPGEVSYSEIALSPTTAKLGASTCVPHSKNRVGQGRIG